MRISNPEGNALAQAGFTAGALFHISLYHNGLMLTRLDDDIDIAEMGDSDTEGADWVSDNGELTLAGNWHSPRRLALKPCPVGLSFELSRV